MPSKGRKLARLLVQDSGDVDVSALDNAVVGAGDITSDKLADNIEFSGSHIILPTGDTGSRPTASTGMLRYNTESGLIEQYNAAGWQGIDAPPGATGISPTTALAANETITIAGVGFKSGAVVKFIGQDGTEYTSPSVTVQNSATIQAETPAVALPVNNEPYSIKITNQSGLSTQLDDVLDAGSTPTWNTASGNIGTIIAGDAFNGSISATDPDGQSLTYTLTSGALPAGLSLNSSTGSITGTESGSDSYASGGITKSFNVEVSDSVNTSIRSFNIIKKWIDGSSASTAVNSALELKNNFGITTDGTYWINVGGTPTQLYCNMSKNGGGWMSFASAPSSGNWFSGNTGNGVAWAGLSYSYGTYSSSGAIGNYWRNYSAQTVSELMFLTGNGTYWISFPISSIHSGGGTVTYSSGYSNSGNVDAGCSGNSYYTVMHRDPNGGEDPWINAGNSHACSSNYMFWGENSSNVHYDFKNANGGILVFVR